ncbi:MAG: beta-N-acetylglucosaminidase domain-containing protein [Bacteroidales bacterium]|nr:beta-N-acetylglucosaminidase domain-containing protein [Bacteroidales bacterium]
MKKKLILFATLCSSMTYVGAQNSLNPLPQNYEKSGQRVVIPKKVNIIGDKSADEDALNILNFILEDDKKSKFNIIIGESNDKIIKDYLINIPQEKGGYYLEISSDKIVIAGFDNQGTFYGVQTLKQLIDNDTIFEAKIKDFPTIKHRGVVEGFYGVPWSHKDRIRQLEFYGQNKLNTYIYGPKDDPYHSSPNWRLPYPENEAKKLKELVTVAKENKVDFVWAIHPGKDIKWNSSDKDSLIYKFQSMYDLGIRSFAVFFDDISGDGTNPEKQAQLLNYIDDNFIAKHSDINPLIMCPTEYNKAWANPKEGTYLDILGDNLNKSIQIMWTGDRVISDITNQGMDWINKRIKRPSFIWWNFPVSDYVRNHLLMGEVYGLDVPKENQMSGFVSNPMEHAEASKIALYSIADYTWNPKSYNSENSWNNSIKNLIGNDSQALKKFCEHNSDLGRTYHGYRRKESVNIKPCVDMFMNDLRKGIINKELADSIYKEFDIIYNSCQTLLVSKENPYLIVEMHPWIRQFNLLGNAGKEAVSLLFINPQTEKEDYSKHYMALQNIINDMKRLNKTENLNPYQPGVKVASLSLQPLVDTLKNIADINARKYDIVDQAGNVQSFNGTFFTSIEILKNLVLLDNGYSLSITPGYEVSTMKAKDEIGINFKGIVNKKCTVNIDFQNKELNSWAEFKYCDNKSNWTIVKPTINGDVYTYSIAASKNITSIKLVNNNSNPQQITIKKFETVID